MSAKKNFKSAAKSVGRETSRKNLEVVVVNKKEAFQQKVRNETVGHAEANLLWLEIRNDRTKQLSVSIFSQFLGVLVGNSNLLTMCYLRMNKKFTPLHLVMETRLSFNFKQIAKYTWFCEKDNLAQK